MDVLHIGSVLAGLILLCIGGYAIVSGGVSLAKKLRISSMIIGLTVVAYGTSTPELAASLLAAFNSHTELILGNIIGSNISNVGMVIGISAIFAPLLISKITVSRWIPIMIGVSLLVVAMSYDGEISQVDGLILIAGLIGFTAYTIKTVKKQKIQQNETVENDELEGEYFLSKYKIETYPQSIGLIVAGVIVLFIGGHLTVDGAVNICNILLILGVSSAIVGIPVVPDVFSNYYIMIAFSLVLFIGFRKYIPRVFGVGLAIAFVVYLASLLV